MTGNLPAYPDLQGHFNADFTGVQAVFSTIRPLSDLTRRTHGFYSVIEEIVEGFVEGFFGWIGNLKDPANKELPPVHGCLYLQNMNPTQSDSSLAPIKTDGAPAERKTALAWLLCRRNSLLAVVLAFAVNVNGCGPRHVYTEEGNKFCWAIHNEKIDEAKAMLKANPKLVYSLWKNSGWTPLCCAINTGQKETVEWLLANGADINYVIKDSKENFDGWTPLSVARRDEHLNAKHEEIVKLLLAKGAKSKNAD